MIAFLLALQIPAGAWEYRAEMTRSAVREFGPTAPVSTLAAQIHQESGWNVDARSWVGAEGLAQFMPATGRDMAARFPDLCAPANPRSPRWALTCRDRYLGSLLRSLRPIRNTLSECSRWAFAFRMYNGGGVLKDRIAALNRHLDPDNWVEVANVNGRNRSPAAFKENTEYPVRIFRIAPRYERAGWGGTVCG